MLLASLLLSDKVWRIKLTGLQVYPSSNFGNYKVNKQFGEVIVCWYKNKQTNKQPLPFKLKKKH